MYEAYWHLKARPFRNTPDPEYFYHSAQHDEALMKLSYAVNERMGAALLTGDYGCGKTLLCQEVLRHVGSSCLSSTCSAQPDMTPLDLLRSMARSLRQVDLPVKRSDLLTDSLLEVIEKALRENVRDGKHTVLVLDEAHMIESESVFEIMRLLLNFHNADGFLLTLLLVGHPELLAHVAALKQLAQRVPISCVLGHFDRRDTEGYIRKRMTVAGSETSPFADDAVDLIHRDTGGIPRRINTLCDLSLTLGCAQKAERIDAGLVEQAAEKFGVTPTLPMMDEE